MMEGSESLSRSIQKCFKMIMEKERSFGKEMHTDNDMDIKTEELEIFDVEVKGEVIEDEAEELPFDSVSSFKPEDLEFVDVNVKKEVDLDLIETFNEHATEEDVLGESYPNLLESTDKAPERMEDDETELGHGEQVDDDNQDNVEEAKSSFPLKQGDISSRQLPEPKASHSCVKCLTDFGCKETLDYHLRTCFRQDHYTCSLCRKVFKLKDELQKHQTLQKYTCSICKTQLCSELDLATHKICRQPELNNIKCTASKPAEINVFKSNCDVSNKCFSSEFALKSNIQKLRKEQKLNSEIRSLVGKISNKTTKPALKCVNQFHNLFCDICNKSLSSGLSLKTHIYLEHPKHQPQCIVCKVIFTSKELLSSHKRCVQTCKICDQLFCGKQALKAHQASVHPDHKELTLECGNCKKIFRRRARFREHERLILTQCYICDQVLCGKLAFKNHQVIQHPELPHCGICKKLFIDNDSLMKHKQLGRTHCDACDGLFCGEHALHHHQRLEHPRLKRECGICEKTLSVKVVANQQKRTVQTPCEVCNNLFCNVFCIKNYQNNVQIK